MNKLLIPLLALALMSAVYASDMPQGSRYDDRIQHVEYNEGDVVVIRSLPGLGTRIVFGPDETIIDVASGFSEGWEFSDRRNILFLKPKSVKVAGANGAVMLTPEPGKWDTNLMVTTNRRMYDFDLRLLPGGGNSGKAPYKHVAYRVEFSYPADQEKAAARAKATASLNEKAPVRNSNYSMQIGEASDSIAPTMAYDDGRFTYLKFPNNRDFPSVFLVAADKTESLVNTHVEKDVLVVQRVARAMVLRLGNQVVGIYNEKFDPDGVPPTNGTTVPGVKRVILGGEQ